jgi:outer membrane protein OmpA-like peptidoglycan-associated protein
MKTLASIVLAAFLSPGLASAADPDAEGCKDPALVSRVRGYHIYGCDSKEFEAAVFWADSKGREQTVEGRQTSLKYDKDSDAVAASPLQITRNYENALMAVGGKVLSQVQDGGGWISTTRVLKDGSEYWVQVMAYNGESYNVKIVQREAMRQDVVANADALKAGLAATGHIEVPGILFDTGKSTLKPESDAALAEVARLLQGNPGLKVYVVGHTDNVGGLASNMTLSSARADAVVKALVARHKVDAKRLAPFGNGPYAPVASNATEDGRARNRRVELVEQ